MHARSRRQIAPTTASGVAIAVTTTSSSLDLEQDDFSARQVPGVRPQHVEQQPLVVELHTQHTEKALGQPWPFLQHLEPSETQKPMLGSSLLWQHLPSDAFIPLAHGLFLHTPEARVW